MARPDYVPRTHAGFNDWQKTITDHVVTNAAAWNIDSATVTALSTQSSTFKGLYDHTSNRNTRTLQQVAEFNQFRISYTAFLRELVQGSLVNNKLVPFNMKIAMKLNPRTGARPERPSITSQPIIEITSLGGGLMEFVCTDSEDGRSKRPVNSDGVKLVITIASSEEMTITNSKTRFRHAFSADQRGKQITVKGLWYNNTDNAKSGVFGNSVSTYIS